MHGRDLLAGATWSGGRGPTLRGPLHDRRRLLGSRVGSGSPRMERRKRSRKRSHSNLQARCCHSGGQRPLCLTPDLTPLTFTLGRDQREKGGDGANLEEDRPRWLPCQEQGQRKEDQTEHKARRALRQATCPGASVGMRRRPGGRTRRVGLLPDQQGTFQTDCLVRGGGDYHVSCLVCGCSARPSGHLPQLPTGHCMEMSTGPLCQAERVSPHVPMTSLVWDGPGEGVWCVGTQRGCYTPKPGAAGGASGLRGATIWGSRLRGTVSASCPKDSWSRGDVQVL